jgi:hypothetical protein
MLRGLWLSTLLLTVAAGIPAQTPKNGSAGREQGSVKSGTTGAAKSPSKKSIPRPKRIILTWSQDPARSQAVTWRTAGPVPSPRGQILVASANPKGFRDPKAIRTVPAVTSEVVTDRGKRVFYHTVEFDGLRPGTQYAYRVGTKGAFSEWNHCTTASLEPKTFQFIYLGDAQNRLDSLWPRAIRTAFRTAPRARFVLYAGDLVNLSESDREWEQWFTASGWLHRVIPCVAAAGNHEYTLPEKGERCGHLTSLWRPQFAFPMNGIEGLEETNYVLDFQGLRVVALDSNRKIEEQAEWLEGVLDRNPARWTAVTFHHPVFSTARGRDNPLLRKTWARLFDRFGVDLVLQGHDHSYGRLLARSRDRRIRSRASGTVYVVSVSGPKMYPVNPVAAKIMQRTGRDRQLFQVITVERDRLQYRCFTVTGELFDEFTLEKNAQGINRLIERVTATREVDAEPPSVPGK